MIDFDEARRYIHDLGFCVIGNPELASRFAELREQGASLDFSEDTGFGFCREFVLSDPGVRSIIDAIGADRGSRFVLSYCSGFAPDPDRIFSLMDGGNELGGLVVHAWPKGSKFSYYARSHSASLSRFPESTLWPRLAGAELRDRGCTEIVFDFAKGGLVISDAQVAWSSKTHWSYFYIFVEEKMLAQLKELSPKWHGLVLPPSQSSQTIAELGIKIQTKGQ